MVIISAFRFEVINNVDIDRDNNNNNQDESELPSDGSNSITIDRKMLDALAKFDRNVRHLLIKGKDSSRLDYEQIVPDLKEALTAANHAIQTLRKLDMSKLYCAGGGGKKKFYNKNNSKNSNNNKSRRMWQVSIPLGSKTYVIGFYWPKLVRLLIGDDGD